jgi:hypothetical protein
VQEQRKDFPKKEDAFNVLMFFCAIHQRAVIVPFRIRYGAEGLGLPALWALVLMFFWWGFSADPLMLGWMCLWFAAVVVRRIESLRLSRKGEKVYSFYDGRPYMAMKVPGVKTESIAKMVVEPLFLFTVGLIYYFMAKDMGWRQGFSYFMMLSIFTLPFLEGVRQTVWKRRVQAMSDARIEQEGLMRDFNEQWKQ